MIDPGPDVPEHVRALSVMVANARTITVALTHGHPDHAAAAPALAEMTGARVVGPEGVVDAGDVVRHGDRLPCDAGELLAVHTPGHTPEHLCYHRREDGALFVGDLFLGEGDTTWVAEYPGCVADYLRSLDTVRELAPAVLYPAHGPPLEDPGEAVDRFERHRRSRIEQARDALAADPSGTIESLVDRVYGTDLPRGVRHAAMMSLGALVEYVRDSRA